MSAATAVCAPLRSGSWAPGGVAAYRVSFSDPGGYVAHIVSWALEYVSPLDDWLDQLVGNEGQVASFTSTWRQVESALDGIETDLRLSDSRLDALEGRTARALRKRYDEIRQDVRDGAEWTGAVAAGLDLASEIVTALHDAVIGALSELAAIIVDLFGFTINPFDKIDQLIALNDHAMRFIEAIATLIERMFGAFAELVALLQALVPLVVEALDRLRVLTAQLLQAASPYLGAIVGIAGGPLGVVVGSLLTGALGGAASDMLSDAPRVTELDPADLSTEPHGDPPMSQLEAWQDANSTTGLHDFSDLVAANGLTDAMGGSDRSVIDIKKVRGEDGSYHWVVSLPSTQDWGMLKTMFGDDFVDTLRDYPATNDLDSNIALMLMENPVLATQYERSVMQAMADAGVPPGGEVVYTGFSQGGIMAANLASNPASPYTTIGVVTNGSPIDGFPIPPSVPVISFEHVGDVVPVLDGHAVDAGDVVENVIGNHKKVVMFPGGDAHNNTTYTESVQQNFDQYSGDYEQFFGTVVDQQQHTWTESS